MQTENCLYPEYPPSCIDKRKLHLHTQLMLLLSLGLAPLKGESADLPPGFSETQITAQLKDPTRIKFSPDGRLFILQQGGDIRIVKDGKLLDQPFLSLKTDSRGEHGILGIEFDPEFEKNSFIYLYYTTLIPEVHNRVSRFQVQGDRALPETEKVLIELDPVGHSIFHSAGDLHYHTDGKLYVSVGDNANRKNAPILTNPFGKILRFNLDGSIPEDNPFYKTGSALGRAIWALGFRNPFSFHFQKETGRLYANEVGAESWEEINDVKPGLNYGWPDAEGYSTDTRFEGPIYSYSHGPITSDTQGCAITGGTFYTATTGGFPRNFHGMYFFIDYCNAWLRTLNPEDHQVALFGKQLAANPVSLEVSPDGKLYYVSRWYNALYSIQYQPPH